MGTAVRETCSEAEWSARQQLAACYRIFDHLGWSESIYNHITVKIPGDEESFLINPYGLLYSEVTASNLIKVDLEGNVLAGDYPVNKAGFVQHSLFHKHRSDVVAIAHTHTTATMAVCSVEGGLRPINFYACNFADRLAWHDFEGITVREEEGERLLKNLGGKKILMLRNHGPVILGRSIPEVFLLHWSLQRACEIQLATLSMGAPIEVSDEVVATHQRDLSQGQPPAGPTADFDAWVRKIDRIDPSWRE